MVPIQFVLFTLFFSVTIQAYINDAEFQAHMKRIREFPCRYPRPTAIKTSGLLTSGVLGKIHIPDVTVLHRCDQGSGCCFGGKMACGPVASQEVTLKFHVTTIHDGKSVLETITARNHTQSEDAS